MMIREIPDKVRDNIKNLCPSTLEALGLKEKDVFAIDSFVLERLDIDTIASLEELVEDLVQDKDTLVEAWVEANTPLSQEKLSEPLERAFDCHPIEDPQNPTNAVKSTPMPIIKPIPSTSVDYIILRNLLQKLDPDVRYATLREIEKELTSGN